MLIEVAKSMATDSSTVLELTQNFLHHPSNQEEVLKVKQQCPTVTEKPVRSFLLRETVRMHLNKCSTLCCSRAWPSAVLIGTQGKFPILRKYWKHRLLTNLISHAINPVNSLAILY